MDKKQNKFKNKENTGESLIFGNHPVEEMLSTRQVTRLLVSSDARKELIKEANRQGIPVEKNSSKELDLFVNGNNHQGVVAFIKGYEYMNWYELLDNHTNSEDCTLVFLDRITDPHNLGAITRTAYLLGVCGIVIPLKGSASVTSGTIKSSAGAVSHMKISRVFNMGKALDEAKEAGFRVIGLSMSADSTLNDMDFSGKTIIVTGSEEKGMRPSIEKRCDVTVSIPMAGKRVGSFNASVATSLVLYEATKNKMNP